MTDQEIINKTNKVFEESFEIEKERLVPQAHIFTDLGLDSLDIVDLVVALQNTFGVKIRNEEKVRDIRTLEDIYQFISEIKKEETRRARDLMNRAALLFLNVYFYTLFLFISGVGDAAVDAVSSCCSRLVPAAAREHETVSALYQLVRENHYRQPLSVHQDTV